MRMGRLVAAHPAVPWPMVPQQHEFRVTVTCEVCGYRQRLERRITQPGHVDLICHSCESSLGVEVPAERFAPTGVAYELPR